MSWYEYDDDDDFGTIHYELIENRVSILIGWSYYHSWCTATPNLTWYWRFRYIFDVWCNKNEGGYSSLMCCGTLIPLDPRITVPVVDIDMRWHLNILPASPRRGNGARTNQNDSTIISRVWVMIMTSCGTSTYSIGGDEANFVNNDQNHSKFRVAPLSSSPPWRLVEVIWT